MELEKQAPRKSISRNPLNVSSEKIEETRARVHGDLSHGALKESPVMSPKLVPSPSTSDQIEKSDLDIVRRGRLGNSTEIAGEDDLTGNSCEKLQEKLGESNLVSSSLSTESDTTLLGLSEDVKWVQRNFKRPLALAMRDILARKPSDPVHFLASWLLNYRSAQEKFKLKQEQYRELTEERKRIRQFSCESTSKIEEHVGIGKSDLDDEMYEGNEEVVDSNFRNYIE